MSEVDEGDSEDERSANNEAILELIRQNAPVTVIESAFTEKDISVNYQNVNKDTFLHLAVRKANKELVEFLVEKGARNIPNKRSKTALDLAEEKFKKNPDDTNLRSINDSLKRHFDGISSSSSNDGFTHTTLKKTKSDDIYVDPQPSTSKQKTPGLKEPPLKKTKIAHLYRASGVKRALHGTIYQSKLLSLFTKRGIERGYNFLLATEMDAAEKFDDVVFQYEENGRNVYRFLQAKHRLGKENVVTIANLMTSTDDDYSLQKYFLSFCKINKNEMFKGCVLKDFIICTNIGLGIKPYDDTWTDFFTETTIEKDDILHVTNNNARILQINSKSSADSIFRLGIKLAVLKTALELNSVRNDPNFNNVVVALETNLKKGELLKKLSIKKNVDRNFLLDVAKEVSKLLHLKSDHEVVKAMKEIERSRKSTSQAKKELLNKLIKVLDVADENSKNLEDTSQKILDQIKLNLLDSKENMSKSNNLVEIQTILNKVRRNKPKKVDEDKNALLAIIDGDITEIETESVILTLALNDSVFKNDIEDFMEKFYLIVNYPSEEELGDIIKNELGEEFLLMSADLVSDSFEKEMLDWFKHYKKGWAGFLTPKMGISYLDSIKKKINALLTTGLSKAYPEKLRNYKINFKNTIESFLYLKRSVNEILVNGNKRILNIQSKNTRLSSIKLLGILESVSIEELRKRDSFIFVNLETLLLKGVQELVTQSFSSDTSHNVLIIECQKSLQQEDRLQKLFGELSKVCANGNKRIIIITPDDGFLLQTFREEHWHIYETHVDKSTFGDLDSDSQTHILTNTRVILQNYPPKTSLHLVDFLDEVLAENIVDGDILSDLIERLVEETPVTIGNDETFLGMGYVQECYVERKFHLQPVNRRIFKNDHYISELFFVSGATIDDLVKLGAQIETICEKFDNPNYEIKIILSVTEKPHEVFREICTKISNKNIHWLVYKFGGLFWAKTKGQTLSIINYIESDLPDAKGTLSEDSFIGDTTQKVVLLANDSGMGKSTVITNMARRIKEKSQTTWVVRINLNDYANEKEPNCLGKINDNWQNQHFLDFLTEMIVSAQFSDSPLVRFEKKLFRSAFNKTGKFRVVIFFDGFDEISPNYKHKTSLLLKALKNSTIGEFWVTTRVHEKEDLEILLETASHVLYPFDDSDQEMFLQKYLRWKLTFAHEKIGEESFEWIRAHFEQSTKNVDVLSKLTLPNDSLKKLSSVLSSVSDALQNGPLENFRDFLENTIEFGDFSGYVKILLKSWKETITDSSEMFAFAPLHLRMLAEIIFENKFQLPANLRMLSLYQEFVKVKFDIYHREKTATAAGNVGAETKDDFFSEILRNIHHELAVKLFFPRKYAQRSFPQLNMFDTFKIYLQNHSGPNKKDPNKELARVGLVCLRRDKLKFVHRSFAEYFLSDYLIKNLQNEEIQKIVFKKVLYEDDYGLVRQIFNDQLDQHYEYKSTNPFETSSGHFDHISDIYFHENLLSFDVETYFKETPVHIAARENHSGIIRLICEKYKDRQNIMETIFLKGDRSEESSLHTAARLGKSKSFASLWKNLAEYPEILKKVLLKKNTNSKTLLLSTAEEDSHEIMKIILDFEDLVPTIKGQLKVAVFTAVCKGNHKSVRVILETLKKVLPDFFESLLFSSEAGKNLIQWAVCNKHFEALQVILDVTNDGDMKKQLLLSTDLYGRTPLFSACEAKNFEIAQLLVESANEEITEDLILISAYPKTMDFETSVATMIGGVHKDSKIYRNLVTIENPLSIINELHSAIKEKNFDQTRKIYSQNGAFHKHLIVARNNCSRNSLELAVESDALEILVYFFQNFSNYCNIFKTVLTSIDKTSITLSPLLHKLAYAGKTSIVEAFLTHINNGGFLKQLLLMLDGRKLTPFDLAVCRGHHEMFGVFLREINEKFPEMLKELVPGIHRRGLAPLHLAVYNNSVDIVRDLITFVKTNYSEVYKEMLLVTSSESGETILHRIFAKGNIETLNILLDNVELDILKDLFLNVDNKNANALFQATVFGKIDILSVFFNWAKTKVDNTQVFLKVLIETSSDTKQNILHRAAERAHHETLRYLIEFIKNDISDETLRKLMIQRDVDGKTPLIRGVESGHDDTFGVMINTIPQEIFVEALLISDSEGNTPSHHVFCKGSNKTIKNLLEWTENNLNQECFKKLFLHTNNKGQTILIAAVFRWDSEVLQLLMETMSNYQEILNEVVLKVDSNGKSALHCTALLYDGNILQKFLELTREYCPGIFRKVLLMGDNRGRNFLTLAALNDDLDTIEIAFSVLEDDFDLISNLITAADCCKRIVLHWAYWTDHNEVVEFLLKTVENREELHQKMSSIKSLLDSVKADKETLEEAILRNDVNKIEILLKEMSADRKNEFMKSLFQYEQPLLQFAAINANCDTFKQLIQHVDENMFIELLLEANDDGKTAIYWAVLHGKHQIVEVLLEKAKTHPLVLKKILLNPNNQGSLLKDIVENVGVFRKTMKGMLNFEKHRQPFRNFEDMSELLKNYYNEMAESLKMGGGVDYDFNINELELLAEYLKEDNHPFILSKVLECIENKKNGV